MISNECLIKIIKVGAPTIAPVAVAPVVTPVRVAAVAPVVV